MTSREHPYRRNAFDAFSLRKDETGRREIHHVLKRSREIWKGNGGTVVARDGTAWEVSEADLNRLESTLTDPLARLQVEQFVQQQHPFTGDTEVARLVAEIAAELAPTAVPAALIERLGAAVLGQLTRFLPRLAAPTLADDLAWPAPPPPLPIRLEPLEQTLLREQ